jgi:hypothetical protein
MGRSLSRIASAPPVSMPGSGGSVSFKSGSLQLTVERRGGREIHREAQLDGQGRVVAAIEAEVHYALGSGSRGVAYLTERDGRLFQSPISWYSQKQRWDLSPGYEQHNFHFDRPIESQCLFCHANRPEPVEWTVNRYEEPIFRLGEAIGCERCHGPGELHTRGQDLVDGRDLTIVNPRHLEASLRAAVCEQCHLLGDQRIGRPGRDEFDFRPGLPMIDFCAVYGRVSQTGLKAVGQVEQMKASRCFRASEGRFGCTSCHDPHQVPKALEKTAYFRQRCLNCHEEKPCTLPAPARLAASRDDSCIECHMPKTKSTEIVHISTTDHRVLRVPSGELTETANTPSRMPLVLLNGGRAVGEAMGLGRELALALAADLPRSPDSPQQKPLQSKILSMLDHVSVEYPDDLIAQRMKAQVLARSERRADAIQLLDAVLKRAPSYEQALDEYLTYTLDAENAQAAWGAATRAVAVNPWSSVFHERLAYIAIEREDWKLAKHEARLALGINPFLRFARMFGIQCLLYEKDVKSAETEFSILVELHPEERTGLTKWFDGWRRKFQP